MDGSVHPCHLLVDSTKEVIQTRFESIRQQGKRGDRRNRMAALDGRHESARERLAERRLGQATRLAAAMELAPDRDRQRGSDSSTGVFRNT
jgi:hypothetical protein